MARKKLTKFGKIVYDKSLSVGENAKQNHVSYITMMKWRQAQGLSVPYKNVSRRELSDKEKLFVWKLLNTELLNYVRHFAYLLSVRHTSQSYRSYIEDVKLQTFITIQHYWNREKQPDLKKYTQWSIVTAFNHLNKIRSRDATIHVHDDIFFELNNYGKEPDKTSWKHSSMHSD